MPNQVGQINEQTGRLGDSRGEGSKDDDNDDVHGNVLRRRLGSSLSFFLFREGERERERNACTYTLKYVLDTSIYVNSMLEGVAFSHSALCRSRREKTAMNLTRTNDAHFHLLFLPLLLLLLHLPLALAPQLVSLFCPSSRLLFSREHDLCPSWGRFDGGRETFDPHSTPIGTKLVVSCREI